MRNGGTLLGDLTWRPVNIGGLGFVPRLSIAADGSRMAAGTDVGGLWLRDSGDALWRQAFDASSIDASILNAAPPGGSGGYYGTFACQIAPSNADVIWSTFKDHVLQSTDGGLTFPDTAINGGDGLYLHPNEGTQRLIQNKMAVDPHNSAICYLMSQLDGLWRYLSGAWTQRTDVTAATGASAGEKYGMVVVDPASSLVGSGVTERHSVVYSWSEGSGLKKSTDGGDTFAVVTGHPGSGGGETAWFLSIDINGVLYLGLRTGAANNVWRSADGGSNWTQLTFGSEIRALTPDPKDPTRLVGFGANASPVISLNSGTNWTGFWAPSKQAATATDVPIIATVLNATFAGSAGASSFCIQPHPVEDRDYIGMGLGVCYFDDPWPLATSSTITWREHNAGIEELVAHHAFISSQGDTILCSHDKAIIKSVSAGEFPEASYPAATLTDGYSVDEAADDPDFFVCLVTKNGNHSGYSEDRGDTWTAFEASYSAHLGGGIAVNEKTNIVVFPGQNGRPRYTLDGGATWDVCAFTDLSLTDGVETGFGFSTTSTRRQIVCADKDNPLRFFAYNYGITGNVAASVGLWETTNGGANWTRIYSSAITPTATSGFHVHLKWIEGDLYLSTGPVGDRYSNSGATCSFHRSTNGGTVWSTIANVTEAMFAFGKAAHDASYPTLYIVGYYSGTYGLHRSFDGGDSFTTLEIYGSFDEVYALAADPTRFGRVVLGYSGTGWVEQFYDYTMRLN